MTLNNCALYFYAARHARVWGGGGWGGGGALNRSSAETAGGLDVLLNLT